MTKAKPKAEVPYVLPEWKANGYLHITGNLRLKHTEFEDSPHIVKAVNTLIDDIGTEFEMSHLEFRSDLKISKFPPKLHASYVLRYVGKEYFYGDKEQVVVADSADEAMLLYRRKYEDNPDASWRLPPPDKVKVVAAYKIQEEKNSES